MKERNDFYEDEVDLYGPTVEDRENEAAREDHLYEEEKENGHY